MRTWGGDVKKLFSQFILRDGAIRRLHRAMGGGASLRKPTSDSRIYTAKKGGGEEKVDILQCGGGFV